MTKVWVYAEVAEGKVTSATLELLTKARELGDVEAIYAGTDADAHAATLGAYGATKVFAIDPGDALPGHAAGRAIAALVGEHSPDILLFGQSYDGSEKVTLLSTNLDKPVHTNGMSLGADGSFGTKIFGGVTVV